ncbi:MAG: PQQ-dependent dehydrogenase, methanol/ethanol family, partial [Gammaproteobacteria bacterium]
MKGTIILLLALSAGHASAEVSFERLVNAVSEPQSWLTYSGTYRSERFSPLTEINRDNVSDLKVIWAYQMQPSSYGGAGLVETTPLVADGIMYLT